ncbi:Na+/H+ antiporter [Nakamurella deserti]|uniref:Na+/H+ antiporter n=1 Tax=Nakamurella deserti TaxID=2164074 RepID=UPI000DBEA720|nr:Na+/H+ antiporter [Nakamurella deserti]
MNIALGLVALVAVVCLVTAVCDRLRLSPPLILVLVGVVGSYLPFVPDVTLTEEIVLVGLLPPLLYAAAIRTSLVSFRQNRRSIGLLSVGYVIFSTLGVGVVAHQALDIGWAAAFALGAVVAPPDAVAATAVARRIGMPRRVVDILEGESLVNDATAIVVLRTAVASISGTVAAWQIAANFVLAAGGGVVIGLAVAFVIVKLRPHIEDVLISTAVSFTVPFVAYVAAEEIHASGVLAVVVAGLLIGHKSPVTQSGTARLSERINWATVQFLLENSVFLLIGLQVRQIVEAAETDSLGTTRIWWGCAAVLLAVLVLRPLWVFPATYLPRLIPAVRRNDPAPPLTYPTIISWAGMRGVVTLAAVFAIPEDVPHQPVLVLAALMVVFGTLILQGFTLPTLVRRLKVRGTDPREDLLQQAVVLQETAEAGLAKLESERLPDDPPDIVHSLRQRMEQRRLTAWELLGRPESDGETPSQRFRSLRLTMLQAERDKVLELRSEGHLPPKVLSDVLEVLDVEEALVTSWAEPDLAPDRDDVLLAPEPLRGGCDHLTHAPVSLKPKSAGVCEDCIREHTQPVHLRMCLSCGNVGCCDSSVGRHADRHYAETGHAVMRSIEPGEAWRWCYVDDLIG